MSTYKILTGLIPSSDTCHCLQRFIKVKLTRCQSANEEVYIRLSTIKVINTVNCVRANNSNLNEM